MITTTLREDFSALSQVADIRQYLHEKRVYITGATGQIGWYLIQLICDMIDKGQIQCDINAHVRSSARLIQKFPEHASLPCRFFIDENAAQLLENEVFDVVIHCASRASPKHFAANPVDVMLPNSVLVHAILEQIRTQNPKTVFVYLSTTGVTGFIPDEQRPSAEEIHGPLNCTDLANCYLEAKRYGEMLALAYSKQYGISVFIVRPSITYGPGFELDDGRSYADFVRSLLSKNAIKLTSDGSAIRNFLYIADFVKGLFAILARAPTGSVYNVASPQPIRILDLATLLNHSIYAESLGPVECPGTVFNSLPTSPSSYARVNFNSTDASVAKLMALGWQQETPPLDGFKRTVRHYQECSA